MMCFLRRFLYRTTLMLFCCCFSYVLGTLKFIPKIYYFLPFHLIIPFAQFPRNDYFRLVSKILYSLLLIIFFHFIPRFLFFGSFFFLLMCSVSFVFETTPVTFPVTYKQRFWRVEELKQVKRWWLGERLSTYLWDSFWGTVLTPLKWKLVPRCLDSSDSQLLCPEGQDHCQLILLKQYTCWVCLCGFNLKIVGHH